MEVRRGAACGRRCKISSQSFVCDVVTIEAEVFVGHGVMFINDRFPRATADGGGLQTPADWALIPTRVERGASIGSNATIMAGVTVGRGAPLGAGAGVTPGVPAGAPPPRAPPRGARAVAPRPARAQGR